MEPESTSDANLNLEIWNELFGWPGKLFEKFYSEFGIKVDDQNEVLGENYRLETFYSNVSG